MVIRILFKYFLLILFCTDLPAQNGIFRVYFTDKNNSPFTLSAPEDFLSQRAIQRRNDAGINILTNDLPVNQNYIDSVLTYPNTELLAKSKWFNTICIQTDSTTLATILTLSFVGNVQRLKCHENFYLPDKISVPTERFFTVETENYYGQAFNQIKMHNGHLLHQEGFRGAGMHIAVLDAGFPDLDQTPAFAKLFSEGRIADTYNFVADTFDVITNSHFHGSLVMSCMGADDPFSFVGTAPDATYYLYLTEDADTEFPLEEDNWVEAAERADSIGVDLINTSLGYTQFDDSTLNHTYADMDGNTTFISRGADIAASKGILVVCSAGNSGTSSWFRIGAPGDADSVLTVGAVDKDGIYAEFSSKGFSSDGDIKPNVAAQGSNAALIWPGGNISLGSGTSFSSPITCGMAACLWQAHPDKNNMQIINAIQVSGNKFTSPDSLTGYGIPDYWKAHQLLSGNDYYFSQSSEITFVYPNPFTQSLNVGFFPSENIEVQIRIADVSGKTVYETKIPVEEYVEHKISLSENFNLVASGFYFLTITTEDFTETVKVEYLRE